MVYAHRRVLEGGQVERDNGLLYSLHLELRMGPGRVDSLKLRGQSSEWPLW